MRFGHFHVFRINAGVNQPPELIETQPVPLTPAVTTPIPIEDEMLGFIEIPAALKKRIIKIAAQKGTSAAQWANEVLTRECSNS